jgi:hypothetical protein
MSLNTIIISRGPKGEDGGAGGGDLSQTDIDTLAKLNGIVADATLIDTGDARLSDARTPTAHTHTLAEISDAGTAAAADVGDFATAAQGTTADSALQPGGALGTPSSGTLTNCTFPTLNQSTTGNAATATALETGRTINGVVFDGSQSITVGCLAIDVTGTLSLSQGGTSADTASGARTNLGLGATDDVTHGSLTTSSVTTSSIATAGNLVLAPSGKVVVESDMFTDLYAGSDANTLLGVEAMGAGNNTTDRCIAIGYQASYNNTTGRSNVGIGWRALRFTTTGGGNVGIGADAAYTNIAGTQNLAIGSNALYYNTGSSNMALGAYALWRNSTGFDNVGVGERALDQATASQNIGIGRLSGRVSGGAPLTGSGNIFIGNQALASTATATNEIVIGAAATGNGSNSVTLGNDSVAKTVLRGDVETDGTVRSGAYTVGTLPTPATGMRAYVTDSNRSASTHFGSAVIAAAGGTQYTVPVFYDGTDWIIA